MKHGPFLDTLFFYQAALLSGNLKKNLIPVGVLVKLRSKQLMNVQKVSSGYVISWKTLTCSLLYHPQFSMTIRLPSSGQNPQAQKGWCATTKTSVKMLCAKPSTNTMKSLYSMLVVKPILLIFSQVF